MNNKELRDLNIKRCECCNNVVGYKFCNQKYCTNCSLFIKKIKLKINILERENRNLVLQINDLKNKLLKIVKGKRGVTIIKKIQERLERIK